MPRFSNTVASAWSRTIRKSSAHSSRNSSNTDARSPPGDARSLLEHPPRVGDVCAPGPDGGGGDLRPLSPGARLAAWETGSRDPLGSAERAHGAGPQARALAAAHVAQVLSRRDARDDLLGIHRAHDRHDGGDARL